MIYIEKEWYTHEMCANNPEKIFVFGDNIMRQGTGGQAVIRPYPNTIGIATKLLPTLNKNAFMSDNNITHKMMMTEDLLKLVIILSNNPNTVIVFPYDGLGTGLSDLPNKAPQIYIHLCKILKSKFNIDTDKNGKLSIC